MHFYYLKFAGLKRRTNKGPNILSLRTIPGNLQFLETMKYFIVGKRFEPDLVVCKTVRHSDVYTAINSTIPTSLKLSFAGMNVVRP